MTEAEWQVCTDPLKMLHYLRADPAARKTLLLVGASIRRHWDVLAEEGREWVLLAEEYAERPGPYRLAHRDEVFGDHWDGISIAGEAAWDGVSGAIDQLWCAYYQCEDYDTLVGNKDWEAERRQQVILLHDIFGYPFRPLPPRPEAIAPLAEQIYAGAWDKMPLLGQWLQEHGYPTEAEHCLDPKLHHVKGCWVVDWATGRE